ncbi:hypothetical protein COV19_00105 [Candidatus Woesearchaeota archaeon CG10_big_fil_rev_8_21_14_0_10_44_13]|nr:MAG: hypothetical protein COV19_00105 [Candidatus Woesearchaeota archaeon CG10_big_fil_rev_8_21_14_0_10_44_13]
MGCTEPGYLAVIGIYPLGNDPSIGYQMGKGNGMLPNKPGMPSLLEKKLPSDDMMKDIYDRTRGMHSYSGGPAHDSNLNALSRIIADQYLTAMREYANAQKILTMGMRSN